MMEDLSINAHKLYNIIRSSEPNNNKKRAVSPLQKYDDEDEEEDDDDEEEGLNDLNSSSKFKVKLNTVIFFL